MRHALVLLLPLASVACSALGGRAPAVQASAVREGDAIRVLFRRMESGTAGHPASLSAEGGVLKEITHSPDRLSVSALWEGARGQVTCTYPYGGVASLAAESAEEARLIEYRFLEGEGILVSARLPAGCAMRSNIEMLVDMLPRHLPARLRVGAGAWTSLARPRTPFLLPLGTNGLLDEGELLCTLETAEGGSLSFLVGMDADGTPSATTGTIRRIGRSG